VSYDYAFADSSQTFGLDSDRLAQLDHADPQTMNQRPYSFAEHGSLEPPADAGRALLDPKGSAIFWIFAAGLLGLVMVSGQFAIAAKVAAGGRAGRK
jgi:hypothetical protein